MFQSKANAAKVSIETGKVYIVNCPKWNMQIQQYNPELC